MPAVFVIFIVSTDPYKLPLALIVVPFILLTAATYQVSKFLLKGVGVSRRRAGFIAGAVSSLLLLLALLQSIRQLSLKDFLILLGLVAGLTLYLRRIDI